MMVAEDVTITEEVQVEVLVAEEVQLQEEKEALLQDVKVLVGINDRVQHQEKVVLDQEVHQLKKKVVLHQTDQEQKVHLIEHQDVQKTLVTHKTKTKKRLTFS
jgi:hypothetical protein